MIACNHGSAEMVSLLLDEDADDSIHEKTNDKWTALMLACKMEQKRW